VWNDLVAVGLNAEKSSSEKLSSSTTEENKYFIVLIILSALLTIFVFTTIGLTLGILHIKGKLCCMKGNILIAVSLLISSFIFLLLYVRVFSIHTEVFFRTVYNI